MSSYRQISEALGRLLPRQPSLQRVVAALRASGAYQRFARQDDADFLASAWAQDARGLNHVIRQFALGEGMFYPEIDSPSYDPNSPAYQQALGKIEDEVTRATPGALWFEPTLNFVLALLAINRRDEPARFEPLGEGENQEAIDTARTIDWSHYTHVAIIVHGIGPEQPGVAISPGSRANCAEAARLYRQGLAPFIIPSGGCAHPAQTIFCEAMEMKRELIFAHGIPASAILIEPHARHTATNFRNSARLLAAIGAPADKPSVSVAGAWHIDIILSDKFRERCLRDLGYEPVRFGTRLGPTAVEFYPSRDCSHTNPVDPLDP